MSISLRPFLIPAVALMTGLAAQANPALPGKTLNKTTTRSGVEQPVKSGKNIFKGVPSAPCPHLNLSLRQLLVYARDNHPALFRQAINLRRNGFTQNALRVWLLDAICAQEGFTS